MRLVAPRLNGSGLRLRVAAAAFLVLAACIAPVLVISLGADLTFDRSRCQLVDGKVPEQDTCGGNLVLAVSSRTVVLFGGLISAVVGLAVTGVLAGPRQSREAGRVAG